MSFERVIRDGGVVLFGADTVYGLACDPSNGDATRRLYELKGRPPDKAAAVMFFSLDTALAALPELGERTRAALGRLMPGAVTLLLPNPAGRFPLACRADPSTLGLRVVSVPSLASVGVPVLQSSANLSGGADARTLSEVPESIRTGVDLVVDGGELPGTPSTVVDLRHYEAAGRSGGWSIVRAGAVSAEVVTAALDGQYHFDPASYATMIREDIPAYDAFQEQLVAASADGAESRRSILDLGTGTGETARRLLARHPEARLVGLDESPAMLEVAARTLPPERVSLRPARLQEALPDGPFDLVASALAVHHLDPEEKADLFRRIRATLSPGGRLVLADVVVPVDAADAVTSLTDGYDKPSTVAEQLAWLADAGFEAGVRWQRRDLAVLVADVGA